MSPYKRACEKCKEFFLPETKTTKLCNLCWTKAMRTNKGRLRKKLLGVINNNG